jgi:hypothetical protein
MTEGNSCYNAGKPGVSDTFAAALWAGDYCLQMASLGCVGVNLHSGANGYYSPIIGSIPAGFKTQPEFYGLMLAQHFAGLTLRATNFEAQGANLTAYAGGDERGSKLVAIFNKDAHDADVTLSESRGSLKHATIERLQAPAIDSKTGVTFGEATIGSHSLAHSQVDERFKAHDGKLIVHVPAYSAALIHLS